MHLLFYWTRSNYNRDMRRFNKSYDLNQNNELMNRVNLGDHIWAFTRREDNIYVLALYLSVQIIKTNTLKDQGYEYGEYNVKGDRLNSRYYDIDNGLDIEPVIRSLSIKTDAQILGQSFQGRNAVRQLSASDDSILNNFSSNLTQI